MGSSLARTHCSSRNAATPSISRVSSRFPLTGLGFAAAAPGRRFDTSLRDFPNGPGLSDRMELGVRRSAKIKPTIRLAKYWNSCSG